jgi:hypothetical protein
VAGRAFFGIHRTKCLGICEHIVDLILFVEQGLLYVSAEKALVLLLAASVAAFSLQPRGLWVLGVLSCAAFKCDMCKKRVLGMGPVCSSGCQTKTGAGHENNLCDRHNSAALRCSELHHTAVHMGHHTYIGRMRITHPFMYCSWQHPHSCSIL